MSFPIIKDELDGNLRRKITTITRDQSLDGFRLGQRRIYSRHSMLHIPKVSANKERSKAPHGHQIVSRSGMATDSAVRDRRYLPAQEWHI